MSPVPEPPGPHHPDPFLQRPWWCLDGTWECHLDPDRRWRDPSAVPFGTTVRVPFAPETPASGLAVSGEVGCVWYRRTLEVPDPGDGRLMVTFGGVDTEADVWVDGTHVAHHTGGYVPFSVDVTPWYRPGAALVVRAADPVDPTVPRGKQDTAEVPHGIWYPPTTGIWKTVWATRVGPVALGPLRWRTDPAAMTVSLEAGLDPHPDRVPAGLRLAVRLSAAGRVLVDDTVAVTGPVVRRTWVVGDGGFDDRVRLVWWPGQPTLLDAELAVLAGDRPVDEVRSYVGIRSVSVDDGVVLLNGRPRRLRFVLDQGYWPATGATPPDTGALAADVDWIRRLGFNGARKHQKTEDPRWFSLADRAGLLAWVEMPSPHAASRAGVRGWVDAWAGVVAAHANHPSVIGWVPVNESWGVPDCERDRSQRAAIEALAAVAVAVDGTRPVSANDGWETTGGDVVGIHDYSQDPGVLRRRYGTTDALEALLRGRRPDGRLADLDRRGRAGRAVVLSEFGGTALVADADGRAWGYDTVASPGELVARYRDLWRAVHDSEGLAGACWTQLTDTYQEVNGLLRADRTPKADPEAIAAATRGR